MRARSATAAAKRDALAAQLRRRGALRLDGATYRYLADEGLSRGEVARAVDELVEGGEARVVAERGTVVVRPAGEVVE